MAQEDNLSELLETVDVDASVVMAETDLFVLIVLKEDGVEDLHVHVQTSILHQMENTNRAITLRDPKE